jgi:hypothetical protein
MRDGAVHGFFDALSRECRSEIQDVAGVEARASRIFPSF